MNTSQPIQRSESLPVKLGSDEEEPFEETILHSPSLNSLKATIDDFSPSLFATTLQEFTTQLLALQKEAKEISQPSKEEVQNSMDRVEKKFFSICDALSQKLRDPSLIENLPLSSIKKIHSLSKIILNLKKMQRYK